MTAWKGFLCDRHGQLAEVISDRFPYEASEFLTGDVLGALHTSRLLFSSYIQQVG